VIRIELTCQVYRPVKNVFAYVTDPENLAEWQPNLVSITKETPGPIGAGTRFKEVRRGPFGRTVEAIVEVSAYEENGRFDLHIVSGPLPIDGRNEFAASDGATRIAFVGEGEPRGTLRIAGPIVARLLRRQFERDYARMKEALESRGPLVGRDPSPRGAGRGVRMPCHFSASRSA
jgi:ligand-binding SRPBCC domain-containing protein